MSRVMATAARRLIAGCLVIFLIACEQQPAPPSGEQLRVTQVSDGDTFSGTDEAGERVRVRLLGIDAPEVAHNGVSDECGAREARDSLQALILHADVTLVDDPQADRLDRYGRRLAYVDLRGVDVALYQVEAGVVAAWYPRGEPRPSRHTAYQAAQRLAQNGLEGAWATCATIGR